MFDISTEDTVAKTLRINTSFENWTKDSWMNGMVYEGSTACMGYKEDDEYGLDTKNPELCKCEPVIKDMGNTNDVETWTRAQ